MIALQTRLPGYKSFTSDQRVALVRGELFKVYRLHHAIRFDGFICSYNDLSLELTSWWCSNGSPHMEQSATVSKDYLRRVSTALLSRVVRARDFNCDPMRTLAREILTNNVVPSLGSDLISSCLICLLHLFVSQIFGPVMKFVTPYWVNVGLVAVLAGNTTTSGNNEEKSNDSSTDMKEEDDEPSLLAIADDDDEEHEGDEEEDLTPSIDPIDTSDPSSSSSTSSTSTSSTNASSSDDGSKPVRKHSDLTQKMRDWDAEKNRRQREHMRKVPLHSIPFCVTSSSCVCECVCMYV
jgi:hypothetical protein